MGKRLDPVVELVTDALMAPFSQNVPGSRERTRFLAELAVKALRDAGLLKEDGK